MKPRTLLQGLAGLAAWGCLSGLALVRLWAVLYGRVPGPAILAAAAALAALVVGAARRLRLIPRLLLPFGPTWRTALLAGAAFFLGALLDTSYGLFSAGDMAIGRLPFRAGLRPGQRAGTGGRRAGPGHRRPAVRPPGAAPRESPAAAGPGGECSHRPLRRGLRHGLLLG